MKNFSKISACALVAVLIIISCKKEPHFQMENRTKAPLTNAGADQIIVLPIDSVFLNGGATIDPVNIITSYKWEKIYGPSSFNIVNANAVQTLVTKLVQGSYGFELTVTNKTGIAAKDTVEITVSASGACDNIPVKIISGMGILTSFGSLSQARSPYSSVAAADKMVFGGSNNGITASTSQVDIYSFSTNTWTAAKLSQPSYVTNITIGNKILFIGRTAIDIYDANANTWSVITISPDIIKRGPAIAAISNKVFFAGGWVSDNVPSNRIDIYDGSANTWSTAALSEARVSITTVTVGNRLFFAGGFKKWNSIMEDYPDDPSKKVDIYDASSNNWSTTELPEGSFGGSAATLGNKVFFHFQNTPAHATIYDVAANSWSTKTLSLPRYFTKVISAGNKILVAGGDYSGNGATVDIYDATSNSWSVSNMSRPGRVIGCAALGNKLLLSIYNYNDIDIRNGSEFEVYDASSNTWSVIKLNYSIIASPVVADNKIFFGGGYVGTIGSTTSYVSCKVLKFEF